MGQRSRLIHVANDDPQSENETLCAIIYKPGPIRYAEEWELRCYDVCRACRRTWKFREMINGDEVWEEWEEWERDGGDHGEF